MKIKTLISVLGILLPILKASAQTNNGSKIEGRVVVAATGETLPNATLQLKKANKHFLADRDGNFSILLNGNDTLIVTHTGYKPQRLAVSPSTPQMRVALAPSNELEEVIVSTGYQTLPKERATGSFEQIDNKLYNEQVSTNVLDGIQYIANGVSLNSRINSNGQLAVRGLSTIQGPKDPLIIVDNFPYNGNIANLNPNNVESITVLKDAAASSIWGAKAGNGVIVITTKKGKFGQQRRLDFTSNLTIVDEPDLFYLPLMSSSDFIDVEEMLFSNKYRFSDTSKKTRLPFSPVYEILFKQRNGQISAAEAQTQIDAYRNHDVRNDFDKYFYQKALRQQYALNLIGGTNEMTYSLSASFDKNIDNLHAVGDRAIVSSANSFKITSRLQVDMGLNYTYSRAFNGKPSYGSIATTRGALPPYTMFADSYGNALPLYKDFRETYLDTAGSGNLLDWKYYPLTDYKYTNISSTISDLTGNLHIQYKILDGLKLEGYYQYERQATIGRTLYGDQSYYVRNLVNLYSQVNYTTGTVTHILPEGDILDLSNSVLQSQQFRAQADYDKKWGDHGFSAIAGYEIRQVHTIGDSYRTFGYNDDILTSTKVDLANSYPTFVTKSAAFIPTNNNLSGNMNRFVSVYVNAAYNYLGRYILSGSARRDASNLFGVTTNNKWAPLWSAGVGWEIYKESFYHVAFMPYLKMRLTYGYSGNVNPDMTASTVITYQDVNPYTLTPMSKVTGFYNPDLRWEKIGTINVGFDFAIKRNIISGSVDMYRKKGNDLYGPAGVDMTSGLGVTSITKNVASMVGKGIDVLLNSKNLDGIIKWTTNVNVNYYKDYITQYYLSDSTGSNYITGGQGVVGIKGKPVYAVMSYRWAGLDPVNGDPQGYLDGVVSKDYSSITGSGTPLSDLKYNGPAMPVWFGSIGNTISYKAFSITARVTYKFGYYFQRQSINYGSLFSTNQGHADYTRRWQKPGDEKTTNVPSMVYPANSARDAFYQGSEILVDRGDNVKLQYINLTFAVPNTAGHSYRFRNLNFYFAINDLGILWKANKDSIDPDYRNGVILPSKSFVLGIRAGF